MPIGMVGHDNDRTCGGDARHVRGIHLQVSPHCGKQTLQPKTLGSLPHAPVKLAHSFQGEKFSRQSRNTPKFRGLRQHLCLRPVLMQLV